jgi:hypothetical protein
VQASRLQSGLSFVETMSYADHFHVAFWARTQAGDPRPVAEERSSTDFKAEGLTGASSWGPGNLNTTHGQRPGLDQ